MNELALFNNLFDNALSDDLPDFNFNRSFNMPKVDVKESKDAYTMEMDLPGMTEKDVNVELDHNVLTISSHHEETKEQKNDKNEKNAKKDESKWLVRERRVSEFSRSFTLPSDVSAENVAATFKNGVLTVNIPRKALASPKKIAIAAA
jgi:HSP20 family protein